MTPAIHQIEKFVFTIEKKLKKQSPAKIILITFIAIRVLEKLNQMRKEGIGKYALMIPFVRHVYQKQITKLYAGFAKSTREAWKEFGKPFTSIPDNGLNAGEIRKLLSSYQEKVHAKVKGNHFSGTIYSTSSFPALEESKEEDNLDTLLTEVYRTARLWNSLHSDEFSIGGFIEWQVTQMVADLFGASPNSTRGIVTSGGTKSIMEVARLYRNSGIKKILATRAVHASLIKAQLAYGFEIVFIEMDSEGRMDRNSVFSNLSDDIAIFASAPSYPWGVVDPIHDLATMAEEEGCPMHVDCCLGGFVHFENYLSLKGVTSLSADTHKNGRASKGSSVLITKNDWAKHAIYAIPGWMGGLYGTPSDEGSRSCVPALDALVTMLYIGKNGYKETAIKIRHTAKKMGEIILKKNDKFSLIAPVDVNVVTFQIHPGLKFREGATYALAHEMKKYGFVLNAIKGDAVHFCVTPRFVQGEFIDEFSNALDQSFNEVVKLNADGKPFPGSAGVYGAIGAALNPSISKQTIGKFVENWLFGKQAAKDAVRAFFLAQLNPYM